ncbi:MAG: site-specific integrase, partial [Pirellulales bacterium]|nr:site-specific integrase [Pirellulales bacterium]
MPRPKSQPKYQRHRPTGQAITRIDGRTIYLGKYDTPASHQKFAQVLSDWQLTGTAVAKDQLLVKNLLLAYLKHASEYYRKGGEQTSEYRCLLYAARMLNEHFGELPAGKFGPRALQMLREKMIARGWARRTINNHVRRVRRMFKWAASQEMVSGEVTHALDSVDSLKAGRSQAREIQPREPVSREAFDKTLQQVASHQTCDMMRLQLYTGMRSGELVIMRPC